MTEHLICYRETRKLLAILGFKVLYRYTRRYNVPIQKVEDLEVTLSWTKDYDQAHTVAVIESEVGVGRRSRILRAVGCSVKSTVDELDVTVGWRVASTQALQKLCKMMVARGEANKRKVNVAFEDSPNYLSLNPNRKESIQDWIYKGK